MKKILFLAANPKTTTSLQLRDERNKIDDSLQKAGAADKFELIHKWAVDSVTLQRTLLDEEPDIVHFSGHGTGAKGLVLEGLDGIPRPATGDALASLFELVKQIRIEKQLNPLHCVLLNACYAENQARAIYAHIDNVIGMRREVKDDAAIAFARGFYDGLGRNFPIKYAFSMGRVAIQFELASFSKNTRKAIVVLDEAKEVFEPIPDHLIPILFSRELGVEASTSMPTELLSEALKKDGISKEEALRQYRGKVQEFLSDGVLTMPEAFQLSTSATVLGINEADANQVLREEEEKGQGRLAEESESLKQYRAKIKDCLSDHQLTRYEKIEIRAKANDLNLSLKDSERILEEERLKHYRILLKEYVADLERRQPGWKEQLDKIQQNIGLSEEKAREILNIELAPIKKAQQDYERFLSDLIQEDLYPFDAEVKEGLQRKQREKKLTAVEVDQVSAPILQRAEEAYQQQQGQRYEQELTGLRLLKKRDMEEQQSAIQSRTVLAPSMKVLIIASNPRKDLNFDRDIRDLKEVIEKSRNRRRSEVEVAFAVRVEDLPALFLHHRPQIVHFCGHGSGQQGLVFEGNDGEEQCVRTDALSDLFRLFSSDVGCVLLNACYSEEQANAIVNHIDYVIGMNQEIWDDAAIAFSKGFYRALGYECSIEDAYKFGTNAIQLEISSSFKLR